MDFLFRLPLDVSYQLLTHADLCVMARPGANAGNQVVQEVCGEPTSPMAFDAPGEWTPHLDFGFQSRLSRLD